MGRLEGVSASGVVANGNTKGSTTYNRTNNITVARSHVKLHVKVLRRDDNKDTCRWFRFPLKRSKEYDAEEEEGGRVSDVNKGLPLFAAL